VIGAPPLFNISIQPTADLSVTSLIKIEEELSLGAEGTGVLK
jgi:hypothetical protein